MRRQIQERDDWLKRHPNVVLDRKARYTDLGKSGRGEHMHGAMGQFLAAVKAAKIPSGSILIVENLDRLGRLPVPDQLSLFLDIIRAGVTIVSTMDGTEYSRESLNGPYGMGLLIGSISVMKRAYDESETKSKRYTANWEKKRQTKGVGTKRVPGWIDVKDDCFHLNAERVLILRRIFQLTAQGLGKDRIARMLNEEGIKPWGVGKQQGREWHDTYISKLLSNPAVIGQFQWHKRKFDDATGKKTRLPVGEPNQNYFPRAIPAKLYEKAQAMRANRAKRPGRIGEQVRNLFTGMAHCLATGLPIIFSNKNPWFYLRSAARKAPKGLGLKPWPYEQFESILFNFIGQLDTSALLDPTVIPELEDMEEQIALLRAKVESHKHAVKRTLSLLADKPADEMDLTRTFIAEQETEYKKAQAELSSATAIFRKTKDSTANSEESLSGIKLLLAKRHDPQFRLRLRDELPNLVEAIFIGLDAPAEFAVKMEIESLRQVAMTSAAIYQEEYAQQKRAFERRGGIVRVIYILFRTGVVRQINVQTVVGKTDVTASEAPEMVTGRLERIGKTARLNLRVGARAYTVYGQNNSIGGDTKSTTGLAIHHNWQSESADRNVLGVLVEDYHKPLSPKTPQSRSKGDNVVGRLITKMAKSEIKGGHKR